MSDRPKTRGECVDGPRPCPWVSCRYHLLLEVTDAGKVKQNWDFDERSDESIREALDRMPETCALDVADQGVNYGHEVAQLLSITRTHVQDIETLAVGRLRRMTGKEKGDFMLNCTHESDGNWSQRSQNAPHRSRCKLCGKVLKRSEQAAMYKK